MKSLAIALLFTAACGGSSPGDSTMPAGPPPVQLAQINKPGEVVDIDAAAPAGYVTVIDFWGEHCGACEVVGAKLQEGIKDQPAILIRKVDVGDGFTPVAEQYKIGALPHFRIYDKRRVMRYVLVGNDTLQASDIAKKLLAEP